MSRGAYPNFASEVWDRMGADVKMEPGDVELMRKGTLDFVSFSYYRSTVASAKDPE